MNSTTTSPHNLEGSLAVVTGAAQGLRTGYGRRTGPQRR